MKLRGAENRLVKGPSLDTEPSIWKMFVKVV
jgi:hypothetical protein